MNEIEKIKEKLKIIILKLSKSLSPQDIKDGWTEQSQKAMLVFFNSLLIDIEEGNVPQELSIAKGMDHWGIIDGDLLDAAAEVSNDINALNRKRSH